MDANKLRVGHKIMLDGQPYKVISSMLRQQPRLAAKVVTKLLNLFTGSIIEKTFTSGNDVQEADIERIKAQYIYNDGADNYVFMDNETAEQFELSKEKLGDGIKFLIEGLEVTIVRFEEKLIDLELPLSMDITVESTEPAAKGNTVSNVLKPATLESGYEIQVPAFINSGEKITVNTETCEYKGRAK